MPRASTTRRRLAALGAAAALAGCAGGPDRTDGPVGATTSTVGTDCFTVSRARDFRYLDSRNLVVFAPRRQAYHLELSGACMSLRGQTSIGLRSRSDRMCGFAGDAVVTDDQPAQRCPVLSVQRLDEDALQALLDGFERDAGDGAIEVEIPEAGD